MTAAPDGDVFTIAIPNAGGAIVAAATDAAGAGGAAVDVDLVAEDFCMFWNKYQPPAASIETTTTLAKTAIHFFEPPSELAARFALRVFGDGTDSIFATSLTDCGRFAGSFAKQRRTTSSQTSSTG